MKYGEYYVTTCPDSGIEREDDQGNPIICSGYYCEVYRDADYENQCDYFCLAVGLDIPDDSEESIRLGICQYLGLNLDEDKLEVRSLPLADQEDSYGGIAMK